MPGLDKINLKPDGIGHALSDNKLAVPVYQRSYAWEEKNILDLFKDVADAMRRQDTEYFLGSIVVTKGNTQPRAEVVNGQQRLATTTALIAAIRDYFVAQKDEGRAQDIETKPRPSDARDRRQASVERH